MTNDILTACAEFHDFLDARGVALEDVERSIRRACALTPNGATREEIVRYVRMTHEVPADEVRHVELALDLVARRGRIHAAGERFTAPAAEERVLALVSVPVSQYGAVAPWVFRGSCAFTVE